MVTEPSHAPAASSMPEEIPALDLPMHERWKSAGIAGHFLQFYYDDSALLGAVVDFIAAGLQSVEGGIVIATQAHRQAIEAGLEARGIDWRAAQARHQYVPFDAAATLSTFMVDGVPNEKLFQQTVGHVITRMLSAGFRARVVGEMVSTLCSEGNLPGATGVVKLWKQLGNTRRFALFCICPMAHFADSAQVRAFQRTCAADMSILPAG